MPRLTVPNKMKTYTEADLRIAISKVADEGQSVNSAAEEKMVFLVSHSDIGLKKESYSSLGVVERRPYQ